MIKVLIIGTLTNKPRVRIDQAGELYATASLLALVDGGGECHVHARTCDPKVGEVLLALRAGDSVALSGTATPKVWIEKDGATRPILEMMAGAGERLGSPMRKYSVAARPLLVEQRPPNPVGEYDSMF